MVRRRQERFLPVPGVEIAGRLDHGVDDIDLSSLRLVPGNLAPLAASVIFEQTKGRDSRALHLTFDRQALLTAIPDVDPLAIAVMGSMDDGTLFVAGDSVRVLGF